MRYLDFLGDGLLRELAEEFADLKYDGGRVSMGELEAGARLERCVPGRHRDLGRRLLQDAKPARARKSFGEALKLDPGDPLSRLGAGVCPRRDGNDPIGDRGVAVLPGQAPEYCPAIVSLAYCFEKSGKPREAIRAYKQALRKNPKLRRTRGRLASITRIAFDEFPEMYDQPDGICSAESHGAFKEVAGAR